MMLLEKVVTGYRKKLAGLRKRARQLREKRPGYGEILDFYVKVREAQAESNAPSQMDPTKFKKARRGRASEDGLSLIKREDFPLDVEGSICLLHSLCRIGRKANPHMAEQVGRISRIIGANEADLEKLLTRQGKDHEIERFAAKWGLDGQVLSFLVRSSTRPWVEAGSETLCGELELDSWRKSHCPVCGSLPTLSLLKGEGGVRYSLCSYCGCQWRIDRLSCSVCGNGQQEALQYFYGEGEEAYRIDLCDRCHHYIKTIDYRGLEESDPCLEDLGTLHLDVLAVQKGYARAVPAFWNSPVAQN